MTIDSTLRAKVLQLSKEGVGRNKIARILNEQNLNISEGSVGNIIRAHCQHEQLSPDPSPNATISTAVIINKTGSPLLATTGLAPINYRSNIPTITPRDGGPLSHLISVNNFGQKSVVQKQEPDIDFADTPYHIPYRNDECSFAPNSQQISESRRLEIPDNDNYGHVTTQNTAPDFENPSITLGIEWDSDQDWERRFLRTVMDDRKRRQQELQLIEQGRQEIEQEKQNIAQMMQIINHKNNDLKAREAKLLDIEPLVPSVRELQSYGITFDLLMPFLVAVNEKSVLENKSPKIAAYDIISELKDYRELGHLQGTVKRLKQQISALDAFDQQKQRAVTILLNLQRAGFSETEIVELTRHVSMWSAQSGMATTLSHINGNNGHGRKLDDKLIGVEH